MDRPKSASDANALIPPPASPTKGILMTPGTAAAKKKSVTFGDHVVDNQEKRPLKSGLPDDCPGKFPSPFAKQGEGEAGATDRSRGRNKLTEALEQARDESRQRKGQSDQRPGSAGRSDSPAPENDCCAYWRREYEVYRTNTQREVKKLVKKYKAAKDYAQSKDDEASDVRLHLQEAETKADALEEAVNLLTSQIKEMEEKLRSQPEQKPEVETLVPPIQPSRQRDRPRDLQALLERRGSNQRNVSGTTVRTTDNDQLQRPSEPRPTSSRRTGAASQLQQPSEPTGAVDKHKDDPGQQLQLKETAVVVREPGEARQAPTAGNAPAAIAARWAAVKEAPQRPSEAEATSSKPDTNAKESRNRHGPANPLAERPAALNRAHQAREPPTATANLTPPPGDLHLPSEPSVYSPPSKAPTTAAATTTKHPPQPTVEDAPSESSPPPPPPPAHATGTLPARPKSQRQDSGSGGTLKALSVNARSGSSGGAGGAGDVGVVATDGPRVGRDGKPIDAARLEAAKARIRGRGRDVS